MHCCSDTTATTADLVLKCQVISIIILALLWRKLSCLGILENLDVSSLTSVGQLSYNNFYNN